MNKRISLISAILCLGIVSGVDAAPSVRVLGSASGSGAKAPGAVATDVKKGNNIKSSVLNANTGVKKSASIKTMAPTATTMQPVARTSSARIGTTGAGTATVATGTNRFSGIASKINVQKNYNPGASGVITASNPNAGLYNIQEISERLGNLEGDFYNKYYTKIEVDEKLGNVDDKLGEVDEKLANHEERITSLETQIALMGGGGGGGGSSVQFLTDQDFDLFDDIGD